MRILDKKLLRDLWHIRGQAFAIALVIAAGVAMFVMYHSNFDSLDQSRERFYQSRRFGDVFASLVRAPRSLEARIDALPGVARADTRVVVDTILDLPDLEEPAVGRLIGVPVPRQEILNDVALRRGRFPAADRPDEVLVSEGFAVAHDLGPGGQIVAIIHGRRRSLEIAGIALSPEYVYAVAPGALIPDDRRYAVMWMGRRALAAAFDMEGGFNDVTIALERGARPEPVIAAVDRLLEPYGGRGAIPRALQLSHWTLELELTGLRTVGAIVPAVFLAVAAFLLNVVLTRIVAVQREQIAALKALGYSDRTIAGHYIRWGLAIAVVGTVLGIAGGARLGLGMVRIYNDFYRFPGLVYSLSRSITVAAGLLSLTAAALGAALAVRRAVRLPPAEAMRPAPPARFNASWVERMGLRLLLDQPGRMIVRSLARQPARASASVLGIAFAAAMLIVGLFFLDSIDALMDLHFEQAQRQDVTISLVEPVSASAVHAISRLPGVMHSEVSRTVAARLRHGHRHRQVAIRGQPAAPRLARIIDQGRGPVHLPPAGLTIAEKLAELLEVEIGDMISIEVLEGGRPVRRARVSAFVDEPMGLGVYMRKDALHRLMREAGSVTSAALLVDRRFEPALLRALKRTPVVAAVERKAAAIESFEETIAQNLGVVIFFNVLFAATIAFGVVYNAARISLSERARELASLRVLGMTRGEIASILLGELALLVLIGIPIGMLLGYGLSALVVQAYDTELYRFPLVVSLRTLGAAALTVLAAAVVSAALVRRKLDHLDLVAVLKTRE